MNKSSSINQVDTALPPVDLGRRRVAWARAYMPILGAIKQRFQRERPFDGLLIGICLHVEAKTGVWLETLVAGGARVAITGSPGSTQDDVAAALNEVDGIEVFGHRDETFEEHLEFCRRVLFRDPDLIADNGADLHKILNEEAQFATLRSSLLGATEETTTGGRRLREEIPPFDFATWIINDTGAKRIVENRYGVGSSVVDGLMRATNIMLHGKRAVVVGYGYCGSGVAERLRGMGAHVVVVETAPMKRLEAHLEGFVTDDLRAALPSADIVVTVTGRNNTLGADMFPLLRDGALLANAGHFASEIDLVALDRITVSRMQLRESVEEIQTNDGKRIFLVSKGNLVNLSAADGNPIEIMDLGLALQSLSLEQLARFGRQLSPGPQPVSTEVESQVINYALQEWVINKNL